MCVSVCLGGPLACAVCPGVTRWCVSLYLEVALVVILHVFMSVVTDVTLDLMTVHVCL